MDLSSTGHRDLEQFEVIDDLLEEWWFFDNLLNRRSRVLRYCHSDPCPSCFSSSSKARTPETGSLASEKNLEASVGGGLIRAPSLPPYIERKEGEGKAKKISKLTRQLSEKIRVREPNPAFLPKKEPIVQEKGRENSRRKKGGVARSSRGNLQRTQTLPSYIGREDVEAFQDPESDARLGFLIREALASSSGMTPPRQDLPKVSSIPRLRSPRNSRSAEVIQETRRVTPTKKALRKAFSNLETEEIQEWKDLGIGFSKQESNPNLSDKKLEELRIYQENPKRTYPAEPRVGKARCATPGPPIPAWVRKDSTTDMKAQIKFWARTVASNVWQEC